MSIEAGVAADKAAHAAIEAQKDARDMDFLNGLAPAFYGAPTTFQVGGNR